MLNIRRFLIMTAVCLFVLASASTIDAQERTRGAKIEIEGTPSLIDQTAGTFIIESLTVKSTETTRYEDRDDRHVNKETFFSNLHASSRVEVKGSLAGNEITAHKIEIEHH